MVEYTWTEHPDVIKTAIYVLALAVVVMGGALISVVVWQFKGLQEELAGIRADLKETKERYDGEIKDIYHKVDIISAEHAVLKPKHIEG